MSEANKTIGSWILTDENRARRVIQGKRADGKPVTVCVIEDWVREEDAELLASARDLERYVSTLLGFLESCHARDLLTDTAVAVCRGIARETGSASFPEPKRPEGE